MLELIDPVQSGMISRPPVLANGSQLEAAWPLVGPVAAAALTSHTTEEKNSQAFCFTDPSAPTLFFSEAYKKPIVTSNGMLHVE
jgi:hypothetical protein